MEKIILVLIGAAIFLAVVDKVYKFLQTKKQVDTVQDPVENPIEHPVEGLTPGKVETPEEVKSSTESRSRTVTKEIKAEKPVAPAATTARPKKKYYHNSKQKTNK